MSVREPKQLMREQTFFFGEKMTRPFFEIEEMNFLEFTKSFLFPPATFREFTISKMNCGTVTTQPTLRGSEG